jgi:uncharacterized protein YjbI with pentapeptide repeats
MGYAQLQQALFSGAHLDFMDTRTASGNADFQDAEFRGTSLYGAWLPHANLTRALFNTPERGDGSRRLQQITVLREANLDGAIAVDADFQGADLTRAWLRRANLTNAKLNTPVHKFTKRRIEPTTRLTGAHLDGANLTAAHLEAADLGDASLVGARLAGASLAGANLRGAHLEGADLTGANLEAADLRDAWLAGARLDGVKLAGAKLAGAHFRDANLTGVDLHGLDLRQAWLAGARLAGANLAEASLAGAHLEGANLAGSVGLDQAVLHGATYSEATIWPEGFWAPSGLTYVNAHPASSAPAASMRARS